MDLQLERFAIEMNTLRNQINLPHKTIAINPISNGARFGSNKFQLVVIYDAQLDPSSPHFG